MYLCSTCTNEEWPQIKICYILISDCLVYPCKAQGEFDLTSIAPYGPILFSPTLICCCSSDSCLRLSPKSTPFFFNQCPPCCFESTWSSPPPSPHPHPLQCWTRVHAISQDGVSTLYWRERGGGGVKGKQRILKRRKMLFQNSVLKTQKINAITQVSEGILSTIVGV